MVPGCVPFKIVSDSPTLFKMAAVFEGNDYLPLKFASVSFYCQVRIQAQWAEPLVKVCFESFQLRNIKRPSWSWSYGSWIYNYLCNQCLSPLTLWVWTLLRWGVLNTTLCNKVCQWLAAGRWFSLGTPVSSTNKTDRHDITEILLKVAFKHHITHSLPSPLPLWIIPT